jgi:hypothetical protein
LESGYPEVFSQPRDDRDATWADIRVKPVGSIPLVIAHGAG